MTRRVGRRAFNTNFSDIQDNIKIITQQGNLNGDIPIIGDFKCKVGQIPDDGGNLLNRTKRNMYFVKNVSKK